ncbi:MAG: hypothetical protein R3C17_02210 [Planctomycetaceae bacterium]
MVSGITGWAVSTGLILIVWLVIFVRRRPAEALAPAILLSFVIPVWLRLEYAGISCNVRTAIAVVTMFAYAVHPQGKILSPLTLLDFVIALIVCSHIVTDAWRAGPSLVLPFRAYGEWALPYVAGRYAIRDRNDLKWIAPWVVGVLLFLGIMSCCESLTKVNCFEYIFGNRPTELANRHASRLGLKRAFGPTTHAIFLGMMIAVLMPWLVCMWQSVKSLKIRGMTFSAGVIAFAGTVSTVSRTPVLTVLFTICITIALRFKVARWPLGLFLASAIGLFALFPTEVTNTASRWSGGGDEPRLIEIDGRAVVTSGSSYRLHLLGVYRDILVKAGPFGFGTQATTGFPLRIPNLEDEFRSANLFKMVDNGYILLTLRFGWIGGACLLLLFLTAIGTGFSLYRENPDELFPGAVACLLVVVAGFSLMLVFMSYDFGFPLLWTFGILSGLASARIAATSETYSSSRISSRV